MNKLLSATAVLLLLTGCGKKDLTTQSSPFVTKANAVMSDKNHWKKGSTISIVLVDTKKSVEDVAKGLRTNYKDLMADLDKATKAWSRYANIKFKIYESISEAPQETFQSPFVALTFNHPTGGNFALIGPSFPIYGPNLSLSGLSKVPFKRVGVIIHELGHVLGLHHEHQHKDRELTTEDLQAFCDNTTMDEQKCEFNVMETLEVGEDYYSEYDSSSIMHYQFTLSKPQKKSIGLEYRLSISDKKFISKFYDGKVKGFMDFSKLHRQDGKDNLKELNESFETKKCYVTKVSEEMCPSHLSLVVAFKSNKELVKPYCFSTDMPLYASETMYNSDECF